MQEKDIKEIAEQLDMGMLCFYHRPTQTIVVYPDPDDPFVEVEFWQDQIDKVAQDKANYDAFEPMNSRESYGVMEDFAYALEALDPEFSQLLLERLSERKPFRKFKYCVEESKYREVWFDFKSKAYLKWVEKQAKR